MKDLKKIIFQVIVKTGLILFLLFESYSSLYSQTSFDYNTPEYFNHNNLRKGSKEKTQLSAGIGSSIRFGSNSKNQFLFSLDFIPRLSNKLFLDLKVDGIKQGNSFVVLLNVIPDYKFSLSDNEKLSGYLGAGITIFSFPNGHPGLDISMMSKGKVQYNFDFFFLNAEIRKPIFFYEDSGHLDLLLGLNFGIKL